MQIVKSHVAIVAPNAHYLAEIPSRWKNGPSCAKQPEIEDGPKTVAHEKSA